MQKRWCYRLPAIHLAHLLLSKHLPLSRKKSRAMLPTRVGNALRIELIDFLRPNGAVRSGDNRKIMKISYKTLWWSFQIRWSDKVEFPNDMQKLKTMLNTNQQHFTKPSSFRWKPEVFQCRPTSWYNHPASTKLATASKSDKWAVSNLAIAHSVLDKSWRGMPGKSVATASKPPVATLSLRYRILGNPTWCYPWCNLPLISLSEKVLCVEHRKLGDGFIRNGGQKRLIAYDQPAEVRPRVPGWIWEINLMRPQWQKQHQKRPGKSIKRYVSDGKRLEDSNGNLEVWTYEYQPIPGAPFSHHQQFISRYSDKKLMQPFAAGHQCGLKAGALG